MDQPIKHLLSVCPPWEDRTITQCGRGGHTVTLTTVDELRAHVRRHGKQRTAYTHCMVCLERTEAYSIRQGGEIVAQTWQNSPATVTDRWLTRSRDDADKDRRRRMLHAIGALVEAHQAEFDAMVDAAGVSDLAARRRSRGA